MAMMPYSLSAYPVRMMRVTSGLIFRTSASRSIKSSLSIRSTRAASPTVAVPNPGLVVKERPDADGVAFAGNRDLQFVAVHSDTPLHHQIHGTGLVLVVVDDLTDLVLLLLDDSGEVRQLLRGHLGENAHVLQSYDLLDRCKHVVVPVCLYP